MNVKDFISLFFDKEHFEKEAKKILSFDSEEIIKALIEHFKNDNFIQTYYNIIEIVEEYKYKKYKSNEIIIVFIKNSKGLTKPFWTWGLTLFVNSVDSTILNIDITKIKNDKIINFINKRKLELLI